MSQLLGLAAVALLVAASAYFVAMEFSFTAANRNRLAAAEAGGDRKAGAAMAVLRRLSFCLSEAQLGITFAALLTGFIAQPVFAAVFAPLLGLAGVPEGTQAPVSLALGFVVSTFALMVLGELAPKNLAIAIPETTARALARSTLLFLRVGGPVIRLFDGAANRLLARLGITPVQEAHGTATNEDLVQIISTSGSAGHLSPQETGLLGRALGFGSLTAGDVMVPRPQVVTLPEAARGRELRELLASTGHSRLPLVQGPTETVVGVVAVKDFLGLDVLARDEVEVRRLAAPVLRVPETAPLADVVAQMRRARNQFAVAVDETGADTGILTLEDVVEELVGEVRDEYDQKPAPRLAGPAVLPGASHLQDVARETGLHLPPGDYDTLAGLVLVRLARLPVVGDEVTVEATHVTEDDAGSQPVLVLLRVESVDGRRIHEVRLTQRSEEPS